MANCHGSINNDNLTGGTANVGTVIALADLWVI